MSFRYLYRQQTALAREEQPRPLQQSCSDRASRRPGPEAESTAPAAVILESHFPKRQQETGRWYPEGKQRHGAAPVGTSGSNEQFAWLLHPGKQGRLQGRLWGRADFCGPQSTAETGSDARGDMNLRRYFCSVNWGAWWKSRETAELTGTELECEHAGGSAGAF